MTLNENEVKIGDRVIWVDVKLTSAEIGEVILISPTQIEIQVIKWVWENDDHIRVVEIKPNLTIIDQKSRFWVYCDELRFYIFNVISNQVNRTYKSIELIKFILNTYQKIR